MIVFLVLALASMGCGVSKVPSSNPLIAIKFGTSGGFTGERIQYELRLNGDLLKNDVFLKKIDEALVTKHFEAASELLTLKLNDAGNLSKFMQLSTKNETKELVWNNTSQNIDERIPKTYQSLINLIH